MLSRALPAAEGFGHSAAGRVAGHGHHPPCYLVLCHPTQKLSFFVHCGVGVGIAIHLGFLMLRYRGTYLFVFTVFLEGVEVLFVGCRHGLFEHVAMSSVLIGQWGGVLPQACLLSAYDI